jgi:hypothetical protein
MKIRESGAQHTIEIPRSVPVRCKAPGLRRVIHKVDREEFFENFEIPSTLHFFRISANHCDAWI